MYLIRVAIESSLTGAIISMGAYGFYRIARSILKPGDGNVYLKTANGFVKASIIGAAVGFFGHLMVDNPCFLRLAAVITGATYLSIGSVETSHQIEHPKKEETTVTLTIETSEGVDDEGNQVETTVETVVEETTQVAA